MPSSNQPQPATAKFRLFRDEFSKGEVFLGLVWLCIGALISVLLEVVYLGVWLPWPGQGIPFPVTIAVAFFFNRTLTATAALWSKDLKVMLAPGVVWLLGFFLFSSGAVIGGHTLLMGSPLSILLLVAGFTGTLSTAFKLKVAQ